MGTEERNNFSVEHINKSELYPMKSIVSEDDVLQVPYPLLYGEYVQFLGRTSDGVIALSNFRLLIRQKKSFVNIPLGLIDLVDTREIFYLTLYCKDGTTYRFSFSTNEACQVWHKRICDSITPPKEFSDIFAFAFHAWRISENDREVESSLRHVHMKEMYTFGKDVERMQFDTSNKKVWRISQINEGYGLTPSYPREHIVPATVSDEDLKSVASFRALRRFPSVVWRDQRNGAVIVRCSQPELGWLGWRNTEDEMLLSAIPKACTLNPGTDNDKTSPDDNSVNCSSLQSAPSPKKMLLIDCRSYGAAFANRAKGGGCESADYYPCCEIQFMNLANIHSIRKSFLALRALCSIHPDQSNWLSSLENTKWLQYIAAILRAASLIVSTIDKEARPVLVHCSDGWDRTPQIVAVAELLLDPYYRTIRGFQSLVEREWLEFGHKFADRCGHAINSDDSNEKSPVFLQWLDCVYQLIRKFPCAFEFNEAFLVKLVQHTYSCLYGTFLCNSAKERHKENIADKTASLWTLLFTNKKFHNCLYNPLVDQHVLYPEYSIHQLELWFSIYMSANSLETSQDPVEETIKPSEEGDITPDEEPTGVQKTRSCENLATLADHTPVAGRRMSDPNISHAVQESGLLIKEINAANGLANESDADDVTVNGDVVLQENGDDAEPDVVENGHRDIGLNGFLENGHVTDEVALTNGHSETPSESASENSDSAEAEKVVQITLDGITLQNDSQSSLNGVYSNGHMSDDENGIQENGIDGPIKNGSVDIISKKLAQRTSLSVESSTDTIIDDNSLEIGHNGLVNGLSDEVVTDSCPVRKHFHKNSSISTSTSDISDPHVNCGYGDSRLLINDLKLFRHQPVLKLDCGHVGRHDVINSPSPSQSSSSIPTPLSSRNSTCPPTPGTGDAKVLESPLSRQLNGLSRHLDSDGLTAFVDPVQQRMQHIEVEYKRQVEILQFQLAAACRKLNSLGCNGIGRDPIEIGAENIAHVLPEPIDGDYSSLGNLSNAASDQSWDKMDEDDAKMTLWVPDHAVTHCAGCDGMFCIVRRRHHCRYTAGI
ncbi:myotubularin-related protein 3-like isoform X2 [Gigantopelta aegis]|uniref:myotubularin-related protein 3-like isoform X2 n=1 Tax=Gigantopelta aegis TaxID=1735272 RepID=UPI001B888F32|nr:myotubularin-related protein 3-like isoform X2 [Gigantopelta aegis]